MLRIDQVVEAAVVAGADAVFIVPELDHTYIRFSGRGRASDWRRVDVREGQSLVAEIKKVCDLPVRNDIEQVGEGHMYVAGTRAIIRAVTAPYRDRLERAVIRINAH